MVISIKINHLKEGFKNDVKPSVEDSIKILMGLKSVTSHKIKFTNAAIKTAVELSYNISMNVNYQIKLLMLLMTTAAAQMLVTKNKEKKLLIKLKLKKLCIDSADTSKKCIKR